MKCGHCGKPIVDPELFGFWHLIDMFGEKGGAVPVHATCYPKFDRKAIPPIGVDIIPEIKLEHICLTRLR